MKAVKVLVALVLALGVVAVATIAAASLGGDGAAPAPPKDGGSSQVEPGHNGTGGHEPGGNGQACGEIIEDAPNGTVGYIPCDDPSPVEPTPQIVQPTPGMADVVARPFDTATVRADGRTVAIDFVSGIEPCSVLDHIGVVYGSTAVTMTLFEGHDPTAGPVACIDIGVFKRVLVALDEPLSDRSIVDGGTS